MTRSGRLRRPGRGLGSEDQLKPKAGCGATLGRRPFQADRGRLGYIPTWCLRAPPADLRRRRFTVHDQTETGVYDR